MKGQGERGSELTNGYRLDDQESRSNQGPGTPALEVREAEAEVGGRTVWAGVDLAVPEGEFVALLGPNGVGKSTLVRAVLGLQPLRAGEIRVLGASPQEARRQVGYLPQRRSFDPGTRVRGVDLVRLGLDGTRWGVPLPGRGKWSRRGREAATRVEQAIAMVGASGYAGRPIGSLSGGEQQRLLIAQALVHRPRLLLLDEPLDSLDLPNQASVAALVSSISRAQQVTVVLVAHDLNPILPYLDRVVYLAGGGAAAGKVEEVVNSETLSRLYGTPIEVLRASDGRLVVVGEPEAPSLHGDRHAP